MNQVFAVPANEESTKNAGEAGREGTEMINPTRNRSNTIVLPESATVNRLGMESLLGFASSLRLDSTKLL